MTDRPDRATWLVPLVAVVLLPGLTGCLGPGEPLEANRSPSPSPDEPGLSADEHDPGNRTGDPSATSANRTTRSTANDTEPPADASPPRLPSNVTMANATVVDQTDRSVTFAWTGSAQASDGSPLSTHTLNTTLTVPPDRWLKVTATATWEDPLAHFLPDLRMDQLEWCDHGHKQGRESSLDRSTSTTESTCSVRPDPRPGWETWTLGVTGSTPEDRAQQRSGSTFVVRVEVTALEGPWSDLEPTHDLEGWPPRDQAPIHPGAKLVEGGCSANFVFRAPDDASLYVGTASHCVEGDGTGTMVSVAGIPDAARLTYCSWAAMPASTSPSCRFPGDVATTGGPPVDDDFALLEVRPDLHHLVHPALPYWGGPTGLGGDLSDGDRVIGYGNSYARDANRPAVPDPADRLRGWLAGQPHRWSASVDLIPPAAPADSGSPILTGSGRAFGIAITLGASCQNGGSDATEGLDVATSGLSKVEPMLRALENRTDLEVELVTWPLLEQPRFPASPVDPSPEPVACLDPPDAGYVPSRQPVR